jgi:branched-chain amino acid transport system ATP-binding protein
MSAQAGAAPLEATGIVRRFGGVTAVDRVSIALARGEVHALIGTNGAGKSTLVNVLAGELAGDAGTVALNGVDVTRWRQPRRARAGLGRSYQRTTIFPRFSVFENCRLAAQAAHQRPWSVGAGAAACGGAARSCDDSRPRTPPRPP